MKATCFLLTFVLYFVSLIFYFIDFEVRKKKYAFFAKSFLVSGLLTHAIFLVYLFFGDPVNSTANLFGYLIPLFILVISLILEARVGGGFFMLFCLPTALFLSLFAMIHMTPQNSQIFRVSGPWLWLHLTFILSGLAGLLTAVSAAMMYLLQSAQIKSKHPGNIFFKLPALDTLDRVHFYSLEWGIILFSLGILSGLVWAGNLGGLGEIFSDKKVILSLVTCAVYWVILTLRLSSMTRGKKIVVGTLLVFVLLMITIFTSHQFPNHLFG